MPTTKLLNFSIHYVIKCSYLQTKADCLTRDLTSVHCSGEFKAQRFERSTLADWWTSKPPAGLHTKLQFTVASACIYVTTEA